MSEVCLIVRRDIEDGRTGPPAFVLLYGPKSLVFIIPSLFLLRVEATALRLSPSPLYAPPRH